MATGKESIQVLVADDTETDRQLITRFLEKRGYQVVPCRDGAEAWALVESGRAPGVMVLDWMMPEISGIELCKKVRGFDPRYEPYVLLLTLKSEPADLAAAFEAGVNDFVTKPFNPVVLEARVRNAVRTQQLQGRLTKRVTELEEALAKVKRLQGLLPICSYCKRVRSDENYWDQVEAYLAEHADMRFTHSICPTCYVDKVEPQLRELEAEAAAGSVEKS